MESFEGARSRGSNLKESKQELREELGRLTQSINARVADVISADKEIQDLFNNDTGRIVDSGAFSEKIRTTDNISKASRMLMRSFVPKAVTETRMPKKTYAPKNHLHEDSRTRLIKFMENNYFDTKSQKGEEVSHTFTTPDGVSVTKQVRQRTRGNLELERAHITYNLPGVRIVEDIYNELHVLKRSSDGQIAPEPDAAFNTIDLTTLVAEGENGTRLDISELLPPGHLLRPYAEKEKRNGPVEYLTMFEHLSVGGGMMGYSFDPGSTVQSPVVYYNTLTKPGSRLVLLHEIAHAWQFEHGIINAKSDFYNAVGIVRIGHLIETSLQNISQPPSSFEWQKAFVERFNELRKEYRDEPWYKIIDLDVKKLAQIIASRVVGDKLLMSESEYVEIVFHESVRSMDAELLKPYADNFVREERDAWAHAIRVLRFLRSRGLDLEPQIHSLHDLHRLMYNYEGNGALASYNSHLQSLIPYVPTESFARPTAAPKRHKGRKADQGRQ